MRAATLFDTGPLVALLSPQEKHHDWVRRHLAAIEPPLLTCEAVLSEACFLLGRTRRGPEPVIELLRRGALAVEFKLADEAEEVEKLLARYRNVPISLADACLVRMAETVPGSTLLTFDGDFKIYRIHGRKAIRTLMPE